MNVMEEIFEIRSCIEILANYIRIDTTDQYMLNRDLQHIHIGWSSSFRR